MSFFRGKPFVECFEEYFTKKSYLLSFESKDTNKRYQEFCSYDKMCQIRGRVEGDKLHIFDIYLLKTKVFYGYPSRCDFEAENKQVYKVSFLSSSGDIRSPHSSNSSRHKKEEQLWYELSESRKKIKVFAENNSCLYNSLCIWSFELV